MWKKEFQFVRKKWTIFNRFWDFSYFVIPNLLPLLFFFIDRNLKGKKLCILHMVNIFKRNLKGYNFCAVNLSLFFFFPPNLLY